MENDRLEYPDEAGGIYCWLLVNAMNICDVYQHYLNNQRNKIDFCQPHIARISYQSDL